MYFNKFRRIVQDYCREFNIRFPSKSYYKRLHRDYNASLKTAPVEDNDITVAQFLDENMKDPVNKLEDFIEMVGFLGIEEYQIEMITTFDQLWVQEAQFASTPKCMPVPQPVCNYPSMEKKMGCKKTKEEVENTMTTNSERDYLVRRIREIHNEITNRLYSQFRMSNSDSPQTYKELIDAITNKQYSLDEKMTARVDAGEANYYGPFYGFVWNMPDAPDSKGYEAAHKAARKAYQDALDIIQTSDAAAGLAAMKAYADWTYTPAA